MKRFANILFSTQLMMTLLFVFAVAIAAATYIENEYDTLTAKQLVYNARWFELVLFLMVMNFIGNINKYKLFSLKKAPGLLMHVAFIVIIIGAGITRYTGFEGNMHIREGESSNVIYSSITYLQIFAADNTMEYTYDLPLSLSEITDNSFKAKISLEEKGTIEITYHDYIKNAEEVIKENVENGVDMIEVTMISDNESSIEIIEDGEIRQLGMVVFAYNNNKRNDAIKVISKNGELVFTAPYDIKRAHMPEMDVDTVLKNMVVIVNDEDVYTVDGVMFAFSKSYKQAKRVLASRESDRKGPDALIVEVEFDGKKKEVPVFGGPGYVGRFQDVDIEGIEMKMAYGNKPIEIPFSIHLNDFILDRYAGSNSPSSFVSEVVLIDKRNDLREDHKIFMNNVLDYDGYRFFQSSYDQDEKGTILSVNHDFYGTWVSYLGYLLLGIGFILTLFNKNSRFIALRRNIKSIRAERKAGVMTLALILGLSGFAFAQHNHQESADQEHQKPVSQEHAEKFSQLIVQSYDGRFEPVHTQAYDVMHKISRKDKFTTDEKGEMDGVQVYMDMLLDAKFWKEQKIIYIREQSVRDVIGIENKYASFSDFYEIEQHDQNHQSGEHEQHEHATYKLEKFAENAFGKKQSERNKFDKEIIKVDERVNVCMMVFNGSMLKLFPEKGSINNKWVSWDERPAKIPLTGPVGIINEDLQLENFNYSNILQLYFMEVLGATKSGNYERAEKVLGYIESIQRNSDVADILPTQTMVEFEISYNDSQMFSKLKNWYGILSVILLLLAFIDNLRPKRNRILRLVLNFFILVLAAAFVYHSYGMVLRWYLTGHAPWSNGYEALILIAWGSLLAGFCFIRNSKITLAATSLLAFFMLMTAGHSSYDPQLTNLQPVLKSYWLIIHVATITISYGFLGLGFILGLMNLIIMFFKTAKNAKRLDLLITELTYINEISLVLGLVLLTAGTFLGGIWANESWGRYWGWDAKETWSLVMIITYTMILHLRLVPQLKGAFAFNTGAIFGFGTLIMTFIGVNYYLSKGLHSYGAGETPVFPLWAWGLILSVIILIVVSGVKEKLLKI